jgi:prepilin-type N-terminal cleavage/methylation domain-containing protein
MKVCVSRNYKRGNRGKSGFSLVEVILAVAIFSMAVGGILGILTSSASNTSLVLERTMASNLLKGTIAHIEQTQQIALENGNAFGTSEISAIFPLQYSANGVPTGDSDDNIFSKAYYRITATVTAINPPDSPGNVRPLAARVAMEVEWPADAPAVKRRKQTLNHVFLIE